MKWEMFAGPVCLSDCLSWPHGHALSGPGLGVQRVSDLRELTPEESLLVLLSVRLALTA